MLSQVLIREWYACGSMNNDKQQAWLLLAMANKEKAIDSVCSTVGIASLKAKQREAITRFVGGEDVFIYLPTGFGKSLCYALLPLVFDYLRGSAGHSIVVCVLFYSVVAAIAHVLWFALHCLIDFLFRAAR